MHRSLRFIAVAALSLLTLLPHHAHGQLADSTTSSAQLLEQLLHGPTPDSATSKAMREVETALAGGQSIVLLNAELHLGEALYANNRYEPALQHLGIALQIAQTEHLEPQAAQCLARMGNVLQLKGHYAQALDLYEQAAEINRRTNNQQQLGRVLVTQGSTLGLTGHNMQGIENMLDALSIFERLNDTEGMAWASLSISRLFNRIKLNDKAIQYAEQALNLYRSIGNANGELLTLTEQANIHFGNQHYADALSIAQQVLARNTATGNTHAMAANHLLIGIIHYHTDSLASALLNLNKSYQLKRSLNDSLNLARLNLYLGNVHLTMGNKQQGQQHLNTALQIAQQQHLRTDEGEAYHRLSQLLEQQGNAAIALQYYRRYTSIRDSLQTADIARLEMQYDFDKREQERELLAQQREEIQRITLQRQRTISAFLIGALVLAVAFALVVLHFLREKQRSNQMLTERNAEIEAQKHEIEAQRDYANQQRDQIASQQQQITDSITYASRIQKAMLPRQQTLQDKFAEHFVIYLPKNIVSGDFYWTDTLADGRCALVVADCTGHGVPGAFMSILGISLLKDLTTSRNETAGEILSRLRQTVISLLHQTGQAGESQDGIDMGLVLIDRAQQQLQFAGAYSPLLIARPANQPPVANAHHTEQGNNVCLYELRGNKQPVGFHVTGQRPFDTHTVNYLPTDTFYMSSDGYPDQFGGKHNLKLKMSGFRATLLEAQSLPIGQQAELLTQRFAQFRGDNRQTDDVVVMGFRIG